MIAFYGMNGRRVTLTNDEAYDLVMVVADGRLDTVANIAAQLAGDSTVVAVSHSLRAVSGPVIRCLEHLQYWQHTRLALGLALECRN